MRSISWLMRSLIDTRSITTSWVSFLAAPSPAASRTPRSASRPSARPAAPSAAALDRACRARRRCAPRSGRPPSCSAASLYFWYSSRRRISSSRGSSTSSSSSDATSSGSGDGHQLARLEVRERRRHHQVVGRDVDRHRLHHLEVLQVLLGDERDRDVDDVDLVRLAQVQQQIERALELGQRDAVGDVAGLGHHPAMSRMHRARPDSRQPGTRGASARSSRPVSNSAEQDQHAVALQRPRNRLQAARAARPPAPTRRRAAAPAAG